MTIERGRLWIMLGAAVLGIALGLGYLEAHVPTRSVDDGRIRAACAQYAGLDLAGWAAICRDAGYQQVSG